MSGAITFTGLGSGTDFQSMIASLVKVERYQINRLESWKSEWQEKSEDFAALSAKMVTLLSTMKSMDTMSEFMAKTVTSSDESIIKATADSNALVTSHTVQVKQLATNSILTNGTGAANKTTSINTSGATQSFVYTYNGVTVSNAIPAGTSLTGMMNIINGSVSNPGVRASILYDGSSYHLQLRGMDLGSSYSVTINNSTTLSNYGTGSGQFAVTQAAGDAMLKIDGYPTGSNSWISRSSNTISDAVEGLTLNLKALPTSSSNVYNITVDTDTTTIKENIQKFVDGVNEIRQSIIDLTKVDTTTKTGSILTGNYGLQLISSRLKSITASSATGFDYNKDIYSTLSQIGISTDATEGSSTVGLLIIDSDMLDDALSKNPQAVAELFAVGGTGSTDSNDFVFTSSLYNTGLTKAGDHNVQYTISGGQIVSATINGHNATFASNDNTITGMHGYAEAGLVVSVANMSDGTYSGVVSIKEGKAIEMVSHLKSETNSTSGPLAILKDNYQDIMDNIDKKISNEEARVSRYESDLKTRFANLEALLGTYNNLSTQLSSQITQLSSD